MADILILGHGPAGVSAALYGLRAGLEVQLVGKDVGALAKAHKIENYFGLEKPLTGAELAEVGKKQALALGAQIVDDEVTDLMFDGFGFVATGLNGTYRGKVCVMATGSARKKTPLPGMAEMEGHGVSYCAVCDGAFYTGKDTMVIGDANSALQYALLLAKTSRHVDVVTLFDKFFADDILVTALKALPNVSIYHNYNSVSFNGTDKVESVSFEGRLDKKPMTIEINGVFVAIGQVTREIYIASGQSAGSLLSVDILELQDGIRVALKTVFLNEEWYKDTVNHQYKIVCFNTVEHIIVKEKTYLSLHTMGLSQLADLIYLFFSNHFLLFWHRGR